VNGRLHGRLRRTLHHPSKLTNFAFDGAAVRAVALLQNADQPLAVSRDDAQVARGEQLPLLTCKRGKLVPALPQFAPAHEKFLQEMGQIAAVDFFPGHAL